VGSFPLSPPSSPVGTHHGRHRLPSATTALPVAAHQRPRADPPTPHFPLLIQAVAASVTLLAVTVLGRTTLQEAPWWVATGRPTRVETVTASKQRPIKRGGSPENPLPGSKVRRYRRVGDGANSSRWVPTGHPPSMDPAKCGSAWWVSTGTVSSLYDLLHVGR